MTKIVQAGAKPMGKNNHEVFAQHVGFIGTTQAEAYLACGGKGKDPTASGFDMMSRHGMRDRIAFLKENRSENDLLKHQRTRNAVLNEIQNNAVDAAADKQYAASTNSWKLYGSERHGMFHDQSEKAPTAEALADASIETITAVAVAIAKELGIEAQIGIQIRHISAAAQADDGEAGESAGSLKILPHQSLPAESKAKPIPQDGGEVQ